jgi:hypothetical protein
MTQIKTIMAQSPEAFDAAVNAALREGERWARTLEVRTSYRDGWLVAILVYNGPEARAVEADQPGAATASPPRTVPGGPEGEGEEPEPPRTESRRPSAGE